MKATASAIFLSIQHSPGDHVCDRVTESRHLLDRACPKTRTQVSFSSGKESRAHLA
jgi:hypothetical protein